MMGYIKKGYNGKPGGKRVSQKMPPEKCPRCDKCLLAYNWMMYLGHLRRHSYADKHFNGNMKAANENLQKRAWAAGDPYPRNGAFIAPDKKN